MAQSGGYLRILLSSYFVPYLPRRQDRPIARTPGTGICKPARDSQTPRYRQMAAAVDEAAQTDPTVPPFDPAVRDNLRLLRRTSDAAIIYQHLRVPLMF